MQKQYLNLYGIILIGLGAVFLCPAEAQAQLVLERELVGAAAASTTSSTGGDLLVDASFGEPLIGFMDGGDLVVTIGFHQTGKRPDAPGRERDDEIEAAAEINVTAYPNPTVERLVVDLDGYQDDFNELRLVNVQGTTVRTVRIEDQTQVTFSALERLPNANYFLQGIGDGGEMYQLGTIMIITK